MADASGSSQPVSDVKPTTLLMCNVLLPKNKLHELILFRFFFSVLIDFIIHVACYSLTTLFFSMLAEVESLFCLR